MTTTQLAPDLQPAGLDDALDHAICCQSTPGATEPTLCGKHVHLDTDVEIIDMDSATAPCIVCESLSETFLCPRTQSRCPTGYT